MPEMEKKRVAIVGSGCAGLGALWALKGTNHDVHLFEADDTLGGHTNTARFKYGNGKEKEVNVDTGFIVYNMATYPNLIKFLDTLGVQTAPTNMTFSVSREQGKFEWAGTSLNSVFAQWANILSPYFWRMLFDVIRFNQYVLDVLHKENESELIPVNGSATSNGTTEKNPPRALRKPEKLESIGEYLEREGYSQVFKDDYLIPMTAAVWSTSPEKCALEFPAITLVRFMWNHHLLNTIAARPSWMTIPGGSNQYIDAVMRDFPADRVHLRSPVTGIEDINGKIILQFEEDEDLFDHVILACHGDQAFQIIKDGGTYEERSVLANFETTENTAYLHSDISLLPRRRVTWSAWNLLTTPSYSSSRTLVSLTYNMNILQLLPEPEYPPILVSLNPPHIPDRSTIQGRYTYHHPVYTPAAIAAQSELPHIQNKRGISYAGAWTKYGFHEDGFSSGVKVAVEHLGAELPWEFVDSTFSRGRRPELGWGDWGVRAGVWYVGLWVRSVEMTWAVVTWPFGVVGKLGRAVRVKRKRA